MTSNSAPFVALDVEKISHLLASQLAASFLGHVLFLKNQVPFPVAQLSRLPSKASNKRALKSRQELLTSFDTLSSHLNTTFTALSTAIASASKPKPTPEHDGRIKEGEEPPAERRVYLAILMGPGVSTAKAKVVLALDGLETKIWGAREDSDPRVDDESSEEEEDIGSGSEESGTGSATSTDSGSEEGESDGASGTGSEEDRDGSGEGGPDSNPPAEATPPPDSVPSSPQPIPTNQLPLPNPPTPPPRPFVSTALSYSEEQQIFRAANRLLSRSLAEADAEGYSLASELPPTQTHIYLQAPRRFSHPAWTPKQNVSAQLDVILNAFHVAEPGPTTDPESPTTTKKKGTRVEGVCLGSQSSVIGTTKRVESDGIDEQDEMIWWVWDGRLVGFSDW